MNQNTPLVSVLMTAFNREKYIEEAIESVLASTYQNWELIIVDDQSKDRSVEIARCYEAKDSRIKVYINEQNLGDYPNRNRAASYANGKYLKYLDADDILYPHGLEVFVRDIEKYPSAGLVLCKPDNPIVPLPIFIKSKEAIREHFLENALFTNSPLGTMIKREAFLKVGGFSGKRFVGDTELWVKIALHYDVVKTVMGLGFWRSHELQESKHEKLSLDGIKARYVHDFESLENTKKYFSNSEYIALKKKIEKRYNRHFLSLVKNLNIVEALNYKTKLKLSISKILLSFCR